MTKQQRADHLRTRLAALYPETPVPLDHTDAFTLLVAVLLSAQCTDVRVNQVTPALFKLADNPRDMMRVPVEKIREIIRPCGLSPRKSAAISELSKILVEQHGGEVPLNRDDLMALPGVGRKTASVVLNELGVEPAIAVDTHVFRVAHRLKLSTGKTPDQVEAKLDKRVPAPFRLGAHHWLILHGRYVCKARTPECWRCPVVDLCRYRQKVLVRPAR